MSARWEKWREHFDAYLAWKSIDDHEEKFTSLMLFGGPDIRKIIAQVQSDEQHALDNRYRAAMALLDDYYIPRLSKTYERQKLREMKPNPGEKMDTFVIKLKKQAAYCDYGEQLESLVVDQVITTTTDVNLKRKCLEKDFTLEEILAIGHTHESVETQLGTWNNITGNSQMVNTLDSKSRAGDSILKPFSRENSQKRFRCFRCNGRHDSKDPVCPAKTLKCNSCDQVGHFARCCFLKRKKLNTSTSPQQREPPRREKRFVREIIADTQNSDKEVVDLFHLGVGKKTVSASVG